MVSGVCGEAPIQEDECPSKKTHRRPCFSVLFPSLHKEVVSTQQEGSHPQTKERNFASLQLR